MESDVRSFLAAFEPVDEYDAPWGAGTLRIAWYLHDGPLPPAVLSRVTSIRCIVLRLDPQYPERPEVLVMRTRNGHTHVWPGRRREPGESPRETATREVWEEAGCRVRGLRPIGFTHLYRTEPPPPGHPYPTEFFYALYAAELLTQDETARGLDKDEEDLGFVPIADLSSVELESAARPIVEAALRAVRPAAGGGSYTAGVAQISEQGVAPALIFGRDQKILFIGDSITDCGRRGGADSTGPHVPYGNGYVHLARAFLLARHGEQGLEIVNRGISGNTVRDLDRRWEQDVIAEQPDWLSVKIGINDVWRLIANRRADHVPLDEYEATLRKLLDRTRDATTARLILMEPYVIAPAVADSTESEQPGPRAAEAATGVSLEKAMTLYPQLREKGVSAGPEWDACLAHFRVVMDQYRAAVRRLAGDYAAVLVRTQAAFDDALEKQPPAYWAADRVHPGAPGHAVIARAWLRAVGYGDV